MLASLPDSYNVLVTVLEANATVPEMEVVTKRLLHEEQKQKTCSVSDDATALAIVERGQSKRKSIRCYYCKKLGHVQRDCTERAQFQTERRRDKKYKKHGVNKTETKNEESSDSDIGLIVTHALSVGDASTSGNWVVDSGATCHICNDRDQFDDLSELEKPIDVTFGDGFTLKAETRHCEDKDQVTKWKEQKVYISRCALCA